ncbi:hypothetical protein Pelo_7076 [Pelomyxa schiedti]|nr:hypothetical protein Pelo_7076 [Pelomyxa schiedti]
MIRGGDTAVGVTMPPSKAASLRRATLLARDDFQRGMAYLRLVSGANAADDDDEEEEEDAGGIGDYETRRATRGPSVVVRNVMRRRGGTKEYEEEEEEDQESGSDGDGGGAGGSRRPYDDDEADRGSGGGEEEEGELHSIPAAVVQRQQPQAGGGGGGRGRGGAPRGLGFTQGRSTRGRGEAPVGWGRGSGAGTGARTGAGTGSSNAQVMDDLQAYMRELAAAVKSNSENEGRTFEQRAAILRELEVLHARASAAILRVARHAAASPNIPSPMSGELNSLVHQFALLCEKISIPHKPPPTKQPVTPQDKEKILRMLMDTHNTKKGKRTSSKVPPPQYINGNTRQNHTTRSSNHQQPPLQSSDSNPKDEDANPLKRSSEQQHQNPTGCHVTAHECCCCDSSCCCNNTVCCDVASNCSCMCSCRNTNVPSVESIDTVIEQLINEALDDCAMEFTRIEQEMVQVQQTNTLHSLLGEIDKLQLSLLTTSSSIPPLQTENEATIALSCTPPNSEELVHLQQQEHNMESSSPPDTKPISPFRVLALYISRYASDPSSGAINKRPPRTGGSINKFDSAQAIEDCQQQILDEILVSLGSEIDNVCSAFVSGLVHNEFFVASTN